MSTSAVTGQRSGRAASTILCVISIALMSGTLVHAQTCEPTWDTYIGTPGFDRWIWDLATFDDGSGEALYAAGLFATAGGREIAGIARWDGREWSDVGGSLASGYAFSLLVYDDGRGPALYVGGEFSEVGGVAANNIARWDGEVWEPLGAGIAGGAGDGVYAMRAFDDGSGLALYAAGQFVEAGGQPANSIAKWRNGAWSPLGQGLEDFYGLPTLALEVFDNGRGPAMYAGGGFRTAGGQDALYLARWDGAVWEPAPGLRSRPNGCVSHVDSLIVFDDGSGPALIVGGDYDSDIGHPNILKWDGAAWSPFGQPLQSGFCGGAFELFIDNDILYMGGSFIVDGEEHVLFRFDDGAWTSLGDGEPYVEALSVFDDGRGGGPAIYAAGDLRYLDDQSIGHIARWGTPDLQLDPTELIGGKPATLTASCAAANTNVYFIASIVGPGETFIPQLNITLDVENPILLGSAQANAKGEASLTRLVPHGATGRTVWLQAAQSGRVSRLVEREVL